MIKHILLFKIKDDVEGRSKAESIAIAVEKIKGMQGKIPGLLKAEAGADFSGGSLAADMIMYSEFDSKESLANYSDHPAHLEVGAYMVTIMSECQYVDYEV